MAGLEHRYDVKKVNDPEGKHDECRYFVLDPKHDRHAWYALTFYAMQAEDAGLTELSEDLRTWLEETIHPEDKEDEDA